MLRWGPSIIEKHFTLDRNGGGPDDSFSEPADMAALCKGAKTAWQALGYVDYGRKSSEQGNVKFRRSLYFVKDMKNGELITPNSIRSIRPGFGLPPKDIDKVINKKTNCEIKAGTPVMLELISD